ncbi:hypothetical protein ACGF5M_03065 [Gemmatimonadota bacterium]
MSETNETQIPLALAAHRLHLSWSRAWRKVLAGELEGEQRGGRWYVSEGSIEELARRTRTEPGPLAGAAR